MNDIPLHPALVHLPLALSVLVPILALGLTLAIHRGKLPRWLWSGVLGLQLLMIATGWLAMQTGGSDEEIVERVVPEFAIEEHEEAAEAFVWSAAALGVVFILGVALPKAPWRSGAMALSTLGSVGVAVLALNTGHLGGELVYEHGAASAHVSAAAGGAGSDGTAGEGDEDDEDDDDDDD